MLISSHFFLVSHHTPLKSLAQAISGPRSFNSQGPEVTVNPQEPDRAINDTFAHQSKVTHKGPFLRKYFFMFVHECRQNDQCAINGAPGAW